LLRASAGNTGKDYLFDRKIYYRKKLQCSRREAVSPGPAYCRADMPAPGFFTEPVATGGFIIRTYIKEKWHDRER
jgi:hypothetical protein